jgi:hypothetical protein
MANSKLVVVVVVESRQQGTSLPLAMAVDLSWNQMDHDKNSLCESHLYVRDSATPSLYAFFSERVLTYSSTSQDPPEDVPPL